MIAIYLMTLAGYAYAGKHEVNAVPPRGGVGRFMGRYAGSGPEWGKVVREHGAKNIRWRLLRLVKSNDRDDWGPVERRAIRLTRRVWGDRCLNRAEGGHGVSSDDTRRLWADPAYRGKATVGIRAGHRATAATELAAARAIHGFAPLTLPPKPAGFRPSYWTRIEALAAHFGGAPFSTVEAGALLGISPEQAGLVLSRPQVQHICEQLSRRVWRLSPRPSCRSRFGPRRQQQLDRARAELPEEFTAAGWRALGLPDNTLKQAAHAGLVERVGHGRYRVTPLPMQGDHLRASRVPAE